MVQPAKDWMRDNISKPLDRACAGRVLPQRNMTSHFIIIGAVLPKNSPKVLFAEHDQMIGTLAPYRSDQALQIPILPGRAESRMPMARTRALTPNARSLSRIRYSGVVSHGNASVI
jgi:hypothetical protein